jgi:hypothetical protein
VAERLRRLTANQLGSPARVRISSWSIYFLLDEMFVIVQILFDNSLFFRFHQLLQEIFINKIGTVLIINSTNSINPVSEFKISVEFMMEPLEKKIENLVSFTDIQNFFTNYGHVNKL